MKRHKWHFVTTYGLLLLMLVACGGGGNGNNNNENDRAGNGDTPTVDVAPRAAGFGQTFASDDGTATFYYPDGWLMESDRHNARTGNSPQAMLAGSIQNPTFAFGEQVIFVSFGQWRDFAPEGSNLDGIIQYYRDEMASINAGYTISEPSALQINGYDTRRIDFNGAGFDATAMFMNLGVDQMVVFFEAKTARGEMGQIEPFLMTIVESFRYTP